MVLRSVLLGFTLLLAGPGAYAQYAPVQASSRAEEPETKVQAARDALLNKEFWVVPVPGAYRRVTFQEEPSISSRKDFVLTEPTSFKIVGFVQDQKYKDDYVRVEFPDGKQAYLPEDRWFKYDSKSKTLLKDLHTTGDYRLDSIEYILRDPPEQVLLVEKEREAKRAAARAAELRALEEIDAKRAAAAAAWKARGGVKIGMTVRQVRASNWGEPQTINRTTGSFGVHEQWVYGGGNYLYFENGVLRTIQN